MVIYICLVYVLIYIYTLFNYSEEELIRFSDAWYELFI